MSYLPCKVIKGLTYYNVFNYRGPPTAKEILEIALANDLGITDGFVGPPLKGTATPEFKTMGGLEGLWISGPKITSPRLAMKAAWKLEHIILSRLRKM